MTKARDLANASTALSAVSATELAFVDGVTSAIQTQMDAKAPSSTAVTLTGTQTLTNKTLTSPALTTPTISTATTNGDILYGTGSGALARLGIGTTGQVLNVASGVPAWATVSGAPDFIAGKNKIINGDFTINQRAFTSATTAGTYGFDRWAINRSNSSFTYSAQTFTPGAAPVAGYEYTNFARGANTTDSSSGEYCLISQKIEDVRTFAGQTVTVSFWAKAASGTPKLGMELRQTFGGGGSAAVDGTGQSATLSTSWARYSVTIAVPSISGKTIGTSSYLELIMWFSAGSTYATRSGSVGNQTATIDVWGVQAEAGSTATPFTTATGTLQGELAACRRYFFQTAGGIGNISGSQGSLTIQHAGMRTAPSVAQSSAITVTIWGIGDYASGGTVSLGFTNTADWSPVTVPSLSGSPTNQAVCQWRSGGSVQFSAEL